MRLRARLWSGFTVSLLSFCIAGLPSGISRAQNGPPLDRTFSPQLFHPAVGPDEFLVTEPALPLPHLGYSVGLWFNYSRNPFTIYQVNDMGVAGPVPGGHVIKDQLSADAVFSIGLWDRLQLGVLIPMTIFQNGENYNYSDNGYLGTVKGGSGFALGDPMLDVKVRIWGKDRGINVAVAPFITFPASLATGNNFGGDSSVTVGGNALAGWEANRFRAGIRFGFLGRVNQSQFFSTTIGHELLYSAAFAYDVIDQRRLALMIELNGRTDVSGSGITNVDANPLEGDLAAKARVIRSLYVTLGAGVGFTKGVGSPQVRGFLGITYAPDTRDRDKDGIPDADDKCPDQPEDKDGFQDQDGCPDPDNDGDRIPDEKDKCPNEAEDYDQFQDEDGCPDPDNDGDGIPDVKDACPLDKEDGKPPKPNDGCPVDKTDSDDDGIPDSRDKCPNDPEDKDGFQDEDGCPDPDNDNDGIPDQFDKCPNEPEDMDGFEDDDGCPDPDNDHDGVPDKLDKCPNEPETINGYKDDDGCPDTGPPAKVQIVGDEIVILEKVFFDTDKATIKEVSFGLLDQLALTVKSHPELKKIVIEGHTDDKGGTEHNKKLSQERAESVKDYLSKHGVEAARLEAKGFGAEKPVADNKTSKGREANRRVEFHITERAKAPAPEENKGN